MKVAMLAPPWLPVPPDGYGGIENVLAVLVPSLMKLGVIVELFTIAATKLRSNKNHVTYQTGQYEYIHKPMYESMPIAIAHTQYALRHIQEAGDFDVIHAHSGFHDMLAMIYADRLPPMVFTLHGPPFTVGERLTDWPDNTPMWRQIGKSGTKNVYVVGISNALMRDAPEALTPLILDPVHNGINIEEFPYEPEKSDYFITLARAHPDKGQAIAARLCTELGLKLKMAGIVAGLTRPKQLLLELANPLSSYRSIVDFKYFSDQVFPYLEPGQIDYVGDLAGQRKLDLLSHARALLFPIQWEEPFGMAPIEALACGTPVVAMARGALPEIIEHGVNGFLANSEDEFRDYMLRVDKIDPADCRRSVEERFSGERMAKSYIDRFMTAIQRQSAVGTATT
jgi:glycosyltransferase involved in cell wall biosynthesis